MALGCLENCFPSLLAFLLAAVVFLYSLSVKALIALAGRYLSPVTDDLLPDLVLHFWSILAYYLCMPNIL